MSIRLDGPAQLEMLKKKLFLSAIEDCVILDKISRLVACIQIQFVTSNTLHLTDWALIQVKLSSRKVQPDLDI